MKKVLLASTALVLSAGVAAADVTVSGDGRMGVIDPYGDSNLRFTSRIRISFSASGETDAGLSFGGSIRADNAGGFTIRDAQGDAIGDNDFDPVDFNELTIDAGGGVEGRAGSVFIEGGFGKISMGDVDGAAKAAVGDISDVGLTGLDAGDINYIANVGNTPGVLYEFATGALGLYASVGNTVNLSNTGLGDVDPAYALGADYSFGNFSVALGYEDNAADTTHILGGVTGAFAGATLKLIYGQASGAIEGDQWAASVD